MDPLVEAAWIAAGATLVGVGGTVIVAVVGFRNTRRATEATNETTRNTTTATIAAARDDRLYEKRAEVYIELLMFVTMDAAHKATWQADLTSAQDAELAKYLREEVVNYESPGTPLFYARLHVYGTEAVFEAYDSYADSSLRAGAAFKAWQADPSDEIRVAALAAIEAARAAGNGLADLVRRELRS
jgi:hypothetical protein